MRTNKRKTQGFTLVEILIVVVILGILAAIVVPQFAGAANEARTGNILTQTQTLETQLELYAARNNGVYPDLVGVGWGAVGDAAVPPTMIGDGYIKAAPVNPLAPAGAQTTVVAAVFADPGAADAAADAVAPAAVANGWMYDRNTGIIRAEGGDYDGDGA